MPRRRTAADIQRRIITHNSGPCAAPGCGLPRFQLARYCRKHVGSHRRNGDPLAKPVPKETLAPFAAQVERLFAANPDHEGLAQALKIADRLLNLKADGLTMGHPQRRAADALRHVRLGGASAHQLLVAVGAVWLYRHSHPRAYRSDVAFTFALANAVLRLIATSWTIYVNGRPKSRSRQTGAIAKEYIGRWIIERLAPFFESIRRAEDAQADIRATRHLILATPFEPIYPKTKTEWAALDAEWKANAEQIRRLVGVEVDAQQREHIFRLGQAVLDFIREHEATQPADTNDGDEDA